jgi:hypothetical protein
MPDSLCLVLFVSESPADRQGVANAFGRTPEVVGVEPHVPDFWHARVASGRAHRVGMLTQTDR